MLTFQQESRLICGAPMLEKKDIQELFRRLELAAQESDQAAQEARAQLARAEVLLSRLEEWRRAPKK